MLVLGLQSGYTVEHDLSPREIPQAQAIFYHIPPFVLIRIRYIIDDNLLSKHILVFQILI